MPKTLTTFDAVVRELGGKQKVCEITKRPPQCLWNWRNRGFFPAVLVDKFDYHLAKRGCVAARHLFRIEKVEARDATAA